MDQLGHHPAGVSLTKQSAPTMTLKEGHNVLNHHAFGKCQLSCKVGIRKKMKRIRQKKYCSMQAQVFMLWKGYENGERSFFVHAPILTAQFVVDVQMND